MNGDREGQRDNGSWYSDRFEPEESALITIGESGAMTTESNQPNSGERE